MLAWTTDRGAASGLPGAAAGGRRDRPGPSDAASEALLQAAEAAAAAGPLEEQPHVAAWREAYRAFGAKPQRTRNSLEALLRRAPSGLPRVNRLTDVYNAVSVLHGVPVGGEDLDRYVGPPVLRRATGEEPFDTVAEGSPIVEHPDPGEVVWCDDAGVTAAAGTGGRPAGPP